MFLGAEVFEDELVSYVTNGARNALDAWLALRG
jgi:hypothetical protein